jgi:hypothetical protein
MLRIKLLAPVLLLLILPGNSIAQEGDLAGKTPTGLVLEIVYYEKAPPSYLALTRPGGRPATAWYARFGRIQNWQLPDGQLPVRAVNIVSRLDGEVASVTVSLLRGVKFHDQETMVGTYQIRENESVAVQELERFGVEPFRVGVKRVAPAVPDQPVVKSLAKSLEIVGIEPQTSTLPRYKLTLRNLSDKNIVALRIEIMSGGVVGVSSMPQGQEGLPLIKAGAFFESIQPLNTRAVQTAGGFTPDATISQETVITALVFEDGSFEGDPAWAAKYKAFTLGRKVALTRLLEVCAAMEEAAPSQQERTTQLGLFRDRVRTLSGEIDEAALAQLVGEFPSLTLKETTNLKTAAEVTLNRVRKELLDDLSAFEKTYPSDFRSWLVNVETRYRTWLSRL